jgi:hypothetical protein
MILTYLYFILLIWSLICLVVALVKRNWEGVQVFALIVPLVFIGFMSCLSGTRFYFGIIEL